MLPNSGAISRRATGPVSIRLRLAGTGVVGGYGPAGRPFLVLRRDGAIVACAAIWDQRASKQVVVRDYSRRLQALRPLHNATARLTGKPLLPAPGTSLALASIAGFAVADDDPESGGAARRATALGRPRARHWSLGTYPFGPPPCRCRDRSAARLLDLSLASLPRVDARIPPRRTRCCPSVPRNRRPPYCEGATGGTKELGSHDEAEMLALLRTQFEGVTRDSFTDDVEAKNWVLLLREDSGELLGFSTLDLSRTSFEGEADLGDVFRRYGYRPVGMAARVSRPGLVAEYLGAAASTMGPSLVLALDLVGIPDLPPAAGAGQAVLSDPRGANSGTGEPVAGAARRRALRCSSMTGPAGSCIRRPPTGCVAG